MCLKNEKNEMSLCDIEIFKTAVVRKWGPIKLGQWLICHKEPLVNYNQRSNDLFEWYLDFPSFFCSVEIWGNLPSHELQELLHDGDGDDDYNDIDGDDDSRYF